jgi:hypothetical protein
VVSKVSSPHNNLSIESGTAAAAHLHMPDVTGEPDPMVNRTTQTGNRRDHLGRTRGVDTSTAHLSGANRRLHDVELAAGDREAAASALDPAWFSDYRSPRDPEYGKRGVACEPRERATEAMRADGRRRQSAVSWRRA